LKKIYFLLLILPFLSCRDDYPKGGVINLSDRCHVLLLNEVAGAESLVTDQSEHFFERVNPIDMMIQMKQTDTTGASDREQLVRKYKAFLKSDALVFTKEERTFLSQTMREAFELCNKVSPDFFPPRVNLVKVKGNAYGTDVFFTRQNAIVMSEKALQMRFNNADSFLIVMLHELMHIYTREHPSKKVQLYSLINFRRAEGAGLLIADPLAERILLNPDGVDYAWTTTIPTEKGNVQAMPLIFTNVTRYQPNQPLFQYDFFETQLTEQGLDVLTNKDYKTTLIGTKELPKLFQEKYNTSYIIHPDEIIASNFEYLAYSYKNPKYVDKLSDTGRELLRKMKDVIVAK
jgi:hypothetical protein